MKKILFLLCFYASLDQAWCQPPNLDELLQKISLEKSDSARFYLAFSGLTISETNPVQDMKNAEIILVHGQKTNDNVCKILGLGCLGYDYRAFGNTAKSLEYNLKAKQVAEKAKDDRLTSVIDLGLATNYIDLADYPKALSYARSSLAASSKIEVSIFALMENMTMGEIFLAMNKTDSALKYTQKAYDISLSTGIKDYLGGIYGQLGVIQARLKNPTLALSYLNLALQEALKIQSPKYINLSYSGIAEFYLNEGKKDSAIVYSKKAIASVENTAFSTMKIKPAKMLLDLYRASNIDSAFKYSEMHKLANDSLFNIKAIQQAQLMTFEEGARQQELAVVKAQEEDQRQQNIQYALIALGIVTFIILFLLLSPRYIANTRVISFLCVIALLVVFEFLNLLLDPFLDRITGHTPILMLLALVCIAALLAPMHHRLEKWTTNKLVEKNKAIRLAATSKGDS